jgi:hypothetical protein
MAINKKSLSTKVTVIFPDIHLASASKEGIKPVDRHDPKALSVAFQLVKDIQPDRIVTIGDFLHLGQISSFQRKRDMLGKAPSEDGEVISVTIDRDMELGNICLDQIQSLCKKTKEYDFLQGNHELLLDYSRRMSYYAPYVNSSWYVQEALNLKERGIGYTRYERLNESKNWITEGKLHICHGFFSGANHLDAHFKMFQAPVVYGHTHTYACKNFTSVSSISAAWTIGTLSTKYASYIRSASSQWQQGLTVVYTRPDGKFNLYFINILDGTAAWNGKLYMAKKLPGLE